MTLPNIAGKLCNMVHKDRPKIRLEYLHVDFGSKKTEINVFKGVIIIFILITYGELSPEVISKISYGQIMLKIISRQTFLKVTRKILL